MKYGQISDKRYFIRLERGEEILKSLEAFCVKKNINNGEVKGIGSVENVTLAHYRVDSKKYSRKDFEGIYEVTSLIGTIAISEYMPLAHLHVTISDESMNAFGGHLVKAVVSATFELSLTVFPTEFSKKEDSEIGLKLFQLPAEFKE